jgi:diguanylate cyclase (GGDEF)-like protein/PAS domain S-box-containing protein
MVITDVSGVMLQVNRAMLELLGVVERDVIGHVLSNFLQSGTRSIYGEQMRELLAAQRDSIREQRVLVVGDRVLWVDHATSLLRDEQGQPQFFVHQLADQTVAREAAAQHEWLAHHDELTSVLNRRGGNLLLSEVLESAATTDALHGLLFIDVDNFKQFNTRGEEAGDAVLATVARRLAAITGSPAEVVRWGGDEFLVLVRDVGDESELLAAAERIRREVSRPMNVGADLLDESVHVTVTVIASLIRADDSITTLIARTSKPLSTAKEQGRNRVTVQL